MGAPPRPANRPDGWECWLRALTLCVPALAIMVLGCTRQGAGVTSASAQPGDLTPRPEHFERVPPVFADETPTLSHSITVQNDTDKTVRFMEVQPACSCTGAELG